MAQTNGDVAQNGQLENVRSYAEDFVNNQLSKAVEDKIGPLETKSLISDLKSRFDEIDGEAEDKILNENGKPQMNGVDSEKNDCPTNTTESLAENNEEKPASPTVKENSQSESKQEEKVEEPQAKVDEINSAGSEPETAITEDKSSSAPNSVELTTFEQDVGDLNLSGKHDEPEVDVSQSEVKPVQDGHQAEIIADVEVHPQVEDNCVGNHVVPEVKITTTETIDQTLIAESPMATMENDDQQPEEIQNQVEQEEIFEEAPETFVVVEQVVVVAAETIPDPIEEDIPKTIVETAIVATEPMANGHALPSAGIEPGQTELMEDSKPKDVEQKEMERNFKKMGVNENWWKGRRNRYEEKDEDDQKNSDITKPMFDKFRTIKQNIKRGNTLSLKQRFENMGKFTE